MFRLTDEQVDLLSMVLCNMILTISEIEDINEEKMKEVQTKTIVKIEKVFNNMPIADDPRQQRLELQ